MASTVSLKPATASSVAQRHVSGIHLPYRAGGTDMLTDIPNAIQSCGWWCGVHGGLGGRPVTPLGGRGGVYLRSFTIAFLVPPLHLPCPTPPPPTPHTPLPCSYITPTHTQPLAHLPGLDRTHLGPVPLPAELGPPGPPPLPTPDCLRAPRPPPRIARLPDVPNTVPHAPIATPTCPAL